MSSDLYNADTITDTATRDALSDYGRAALATSCARFLYTLVGDLSDDAIAAWYASLDSDAPDLLGYPADARTALAGAETGLRLAREAEVAAHARMVEALNAVIVAGCPAATILETARHLGADDARVSDLVEAKAREVIDSHAAARAGV